MREISLHILDLAQNSIKAGASLIEIEVDEDVAHNRFVFSIRDNGCGMSKDFLDRVTDPFVTTRTTRKVGLGISLTKAGCEACDGSFTIESEEGKGTFLKAMYRYDHIDRQPLGAIEDTVSSLVLMNPEIDFVYRHQYNGESFELDTREVRLVMEDVPLNEPNVVNFIREFIAENRTSLIGGV